MFIAVYVWEGIASSISVNDDIEILKDEMIKMVEEVGFDPAYDDLKIFDKNNNIAWSYETDYYNEQDENKIKCTSCGQKCFDDQYPEVVFKDKQYCICEDCSIDYEEVNGKVQLRNDNK